jgi:hypothetical protein
MGSAYAFVGPTVVDNITTAEVPTLSRDNSISSKVTRMQNLNF